MVDWDYKGDKVDRINQQKRLIVMHVRNVDEKLKNYIVDIVFATRDLEKYNLGDLKDFVQYGGSPRATIYLTKASQAHAFMRGRGYVIPEDIKAVGHDVLRHRIIPSYEAEAEGITTEDLIDKIFDEIEVP